MKRDYIIEAPSVIDFIPTKKFGNALYVNREQPISIFKAVEQIATYFQKEGGFSFLQYSAYEKRRIKTTDAYIWIDEDWDDTLAIGACAFSKDGDVGGNGKWGLQWVWIHPYYRNRGLLTEAWPHFEKKYGKCFDIEKPLSKHMESFLNKMAISKNDE